MVGGGGGYELQPRHRSIHRLLTPRSTLPRLPLPAFKSATVWLTRHRLPESLSGMAEEQWRVGWQCQIKRDRRAACCGDKSGKLPKIATPLLPSFFLRSSLPDRPTNPPNCWRYCRAAVAAPAGGCHKRRTRTRAPSLVSVTRIPLPCQIPPLVTAKPLKTHQRLLLNSPFNLTLCLSYCSLHLHASCWPQHPPPLTRDPANGTSQYCRGAKDTVHFTSPYRPTLSRTPSI